jgi:hypothetical protein
MEKAGRSSVEDRTGIGVASRATCSGVLVAYCFWLMEKAV